MYCWTNNCGLGCVLDIKFIVFLFPINTQKMSLLICLRTLLLALLKKVKNNEVVAR